MTRGKLMLATMILCFIAGAACFAGNAHRILHANSHSCQLALCGSMLFLLGGTAGMLSTVSLRRDCRRLTQMMRTTGVEKQPPRVESDTAELIPLVSSINQTLDAAEQRVADALLKARELEIQLKVATAERQHAEAIIYSISDAVLVTDPFDELVLANQSAARTFQFDLEKSNRVPVDHVLRDPKLVELIREMRQSDNPSGRRLVEHTVKNAAGERTFSVTLSPVADPNNAPAGVVAVLHDVTREKEVAKIKNDFVSNVSHELRTPLASIKAYVEMLIDGEADDEKTAREFYEVIQNEANRLGRLIDNILNISRIESGLVKINKQPQSLTVILKDALEVIVPQARGKQIHLVEQLTPVFYQTLADRDMLYQAVLNLLSNAVKYTPEGGTITVQTLVDESKRRVITKIFDTGVGIPPKDLPFVFDKFYRVDANNHMAKGTGLGLSLVKHIIETVHHGHLFVESQVGKGSCFGFELELCQ
jgi:two-component system, OmpR family, phosphate regulon sensor histidine kinase PhoR